MNDEQVPVLAVDGAVLTVARLASTGGGNARLDAAGIFYLQAVDRAVVVAGLRGAENFIAVANDGSKRGA